MAPMQEAGQNTCSKNENKDAHDAFQAISMSEPLCEPLLLTCFGAWDAPAALYVYVKCTNVICNRSEFD